MTEARQSDALKKLVLFIIGLAIAGTIIAFVWYFGVEVPARMPPLNSGTGDGEWFYDLVDEFMCYFFNVC